MTSAKKYDPDDIKLRELVLYLATLSEGDATFGKVKLNKLLFYADFNAYLKFGKPITGHEYQKLKNGPAPRRLLPVIPSLGNPPGPDRDVGVRQDTFHGWNQYRPLALRQPDTSVFSVQESELVRELVDHFKGKTAREMSDRSHLFIGWQLAEEGETIPYETALTSFRKPNDGEIMAGLQLQELAQSVLSGGDISADSGPLP